MGMLVTICKLSTGSLSGQAARLRIPRPLRWGRQGVGWVEGSLTVAVISPEQMCPLEPQ